MAGFYLRPECVFYFVEMLKFLVDKVRTLTPTIPYE